MATTKLTVGPTIIDIDVIQGTDALLTFQYEKKVNGVWVPVDITNDRIKFTARDSDGGVITINTKTNVPGDHVDPSNGKTLFRLTQTDTLSDPTSKVVWSYEVRHIDESDREFVFVKGRLNLLPTVGEEE